MLCKKYNCLCERQRNIIHSNNFIQYRNNILNNIRAILIDNKYKCNQYYDKTLEQKKRDPCLNLNANKPFSAILQENIARAEARKMV